jgi:hypothetical protein
VLACQFPTIGTNNMVDLEDTNTKKYMVLIMLYDNGQSLGHICILTFWCVESLSEFNDLYTHASSVGE